MAKAKKKERKNKSKKPRNMTWSHKVVGAGYIGAYEYNKSNVREFVLRKEGKPHLSFASPNAAMKLKWKGAYKA